MNSADECDPDECRRIHAVECSDQSVKLVFLYPWSAECMTILKLSKVSWAFHGWISDKCIFIHTNCYLQVNDLNFAESATCTCNVLQVSRQEITSERQKMAYFCIISTNVNFNLIEPVIYPSQFDWFETAGHLITNFCSISVKLVCFMHLVITVNGEASSTGLSGV